jgi:hypothetical protein
MQKPPRCFAAWSRRAIPCLRASSALLRKRRAASSPGEHSHCELNSVRELVQQLGGPAEGQTQRFKTVPQPIDPKGPPSALAVIMIDGYQISHRGPDWAKKKAQKLRVEGHEQKVGMFYYQRRTVCCWKNEYEMARIAGGIGRVARLGGLQSWSGQSPTNAWRCRRSTGI